MSRVNAGDDTVPKLTGCPVSLSWPGAGGGQAKVVARPWGKCYVSRSLEALMRTPFRLLAAALLVLGWVSMAWPAEQHHLNVWGRPQVFDVVPPTVPYVEINAVTFALSPSTLNGSLYQMSGSCTQTTRLTREEAQELIDHLSAWLAYPEEETLLFEKRIAPPAKFNALTSNQGKGQLGDAGRDVRH